MVDPESNKLVSGPASSPENSFYAPDGSRGSISMGPSHDQQIINELFSNVITASNVLNDKDPFIEELKVANSNLQQVQIGSDGRIMEWAKEYKEVEPGHRHLSHLYGLYPGSLFNETSTHQLVSAAEKSLKYRLENGGGANQTGWSAAWVTNLWARLKKGDEALKSFNLILLKKTSENLFNSHPPFQIDGNFGATAGVAEMLLQSHDAYIELLPALPSVWKNGEVKGLCARGGFDANIKWVDGKLVAGMIYSKMGGKAVIRYRNKQISLSTEANKQYDLAALTSR